MDEATLCTDIARLAALTDRLRPSDAEDGVAAEANIAAETLRLRSHPDEAAALAAAMRRLLTLPHQSAFYAETGVHSALGFLLEFKQRLGQRLLPPAPDPARLRDALGMIFTRRDDDVWLSIVADEAWVELARALGLHQSSHLAADEVLANLYEALRLLSYRLAGAALDRELLRAGPDLERHESPFLAQNAALVPLLTAPGHALPPDEVSHVDVLLAQCDEVLERVRRKAAQKGISIRLTYLLARLSQLIGRMRELFDLAAELDRLPRAVRLMKTLLAAEKQRQRLLPFVGGNVSLLARNVTDHASRHGEHYIAENRTDWWAMAKGAAGGGIVIAFMALAKIKLAALHLPPLTEGIAFGLNYGLGFVLIHLLGFTVATKQPAMTAASIAAGVEEARPRELGRLADLVQNVSRTQFIAVLGNIGLALPVAWLIAMAGIALTGASPASPEKATHMLHEVHPFASGSLFFAAVAGVGLFLSGLVSGYYDNQARYHGLAARIAHQPWLRRFGAERATRFGDYLDAHYGAILGNLFFGLYLGLAGAFGVLTGLPVDIRHVAFSSANLGTALATLDRAALADALPWATAGVACIALINLAVSFLLALYVAMKSRGQGFTQMLGLGKILGRRLLTKPLSFMLPPPRSP